MLVDDEDFEKVNKHKWSIHKVRNCIYARTEIQGKQTLMHKFITGFKQTDHIDMNGLNNQRNNLREVTASQNRMNVFPRKNSSSKYKGVTKTVNKTYMAQIRFKGQRVYLGCYGSEDEAGLAYNKKASELFGEYARLNIV